MNVIGPKYQRGNEVGVKRPVLRGRSNCPQRENAIRATSLAINRTAISIRTDADEIPFARRTSRIARGLPFPCADGYSKRNAEAWKAKLSAHSAKSGVFPAGALGQTGEAKVGFVIDRSGKLVSRALAARTGSRLLDDAALEIVARAQPFPAPSVRRSICRGC
ncbi:energy transducer TonB [Bradyrhizobium sp. PMVTL-01]